MHIGRNDFLRWCDQDYIYKNMYNEDKEEIEKNELQKFVDYYFDYIEDLTDYVEINSFTDWLHELTEEEIKEIKGAK